jgi:hypothetical protein
VLLEESCVDVCFFFFCMVLIWVLLAASFESVCVGSSAIIPYPFALWKGV